MKEQIQISKEHLENLMNQAFTLVDQKLYKHAAVTFRKIITYDPENTIAKTYIEAISAAEKVEQYHEEHRKYPKKLSDISKDESDQYSSELFDYRFKGGDKFCISFVLSTGKQPHPIGNGCKENPDQEKVLGKLETPESERRILEQALYSTDPKNFGKWGYGYTDESEQGYYVINDRQYGPYDKIDEFSPYLTSDRYAFLYQKNESWFVQVNEKKIGPIEGSELDFRFYLGGWTLRYRGTDNQYYVLIDGRKTYGPYIYADQVYTSGANWAFRHCTFHIEEYAERLILKKSSATASCGIIINQKEMGLFDMVEEPKLSNSDQAYIFTKDNRRFAWMNSKIFGPYDGNRGLDIRYVEGNRVIEHEEDDGFYLNINDDEIGPLPYVSGSGLEFSKHHWGFRYKDSENRRFVVIDGNTYGPYKSASEPIFSAKNWGFTFAEMTGGQKVMINGTIQGPFESAGRLQLSDYTVAFQYKDPDGYYLSINDKTIGPYEKMKAVIISGANWGFEYKDKKNEHYLMINGNIFGPYKSQTKFLSVYDPIQTELKFTEDTWIFHYIDGNGGEHIVADGEDFGPYLHGGSDDFVHPTQLEIYEGNWAFWYEDADKKQYQVVNGNIFGPLQRAYDGAFQFGKSTWGFRYKNFNQEYYVLIGGKKYGPYASVNKPKLEK